MIIRWLILVLLYQTNKLDGCDSIKNVEITENTGQGYLLADVSDHITRSGSKINSFYLSEETDSFHLKDGRLILRKPIDREEYCAKSNKHQTNINVQCCGGQCCIFIGITSNDNTKKKFYIKIKVTDINDNSPIFPEKIYYKEILENSKINTRISLPTATDADDLNFGIDSYEIEKPNENFEIYFKLMIENNIDNSKQPILIVKHQIDRETIDRIEFNLIANDGGKPCRKGKTKIILKILDENDSEPQFSQQIYDIKVKENEINGLELLHVKVEDKDFGNNGKLSINFAQSTSQEIQNTFQLSQTLHGVVLKLISKLDYETTNKYSFNLVAKDFGQPPRSSTALVEVYVTNVNDSPPNIVFYQFNKPISKQFARIYMNEGITKDMVICLVKVTDEDNQADSISCDIEMSQESFYLNSLKTNIVLENKKTYELKSKIDFDRETKTLHYVSIVCSDSEGMNQLRQTNKLEVIIKDINDNSPVFTSPRYYGTIKENRINEIVSIKKDPIIATDRDEGENGTVEYYISDVSDDMRNYFSIEKSTAVIKAVMGLDYEKIKQISIIIMAKDLGNPSRSSTTNLIINIKDTNDNQPEVDLSFYSFELYENEPIGTFVGKINVTDKDTDIDNKKVIMKIKNFSPIQISTDQPVEQIFTIDNDSGKIYTKIVLDREKSSQITFTVVASNPNPLDLGNERIEYMRQSRETLEISVTVNVLDKNDNSPIMVLKEKPNIKAVNPEVSFLRSLSNENGFHENCVAFPYIFVDPDEGENSKIRVTMKGNDLFSLTADHGMLCAVEKLPAIGDYRTLIIAEDGDFNNSRKQEFLVNIHIKEDPNTITSKHRFNHGNQDLKIYNDNINRNNDRYFRNNLIYIIIGSIAAILFLMLITILIKFRRFLIGETNFASTTSKNAPDSLECQDFFECVPDSKYNDLSFVKNMQPENYRNEYQFKSIESKINEKYESTDPIFHDVRQFKISSKQIPQSYNYQTIPTQFLPEAMHLYHSLSNTKSEIVFQQPNNNFTNITNTQVSISSNSPVFTNSQSTSNVLNTIKSKNPILKPPFQSTFV